MSERIEIKNPAIYGGCVYYAQNREDLILQAFFPDQENGFYVDVGAYDPEQDSVTKLFYDKGWNGINIEPQADRCARFNTERKRDINLNIGISDKPGELTLRVYKNEGWATFSHDMKSENKKSKDKSLNIYKEVKTKVLTLRDVFKENRVTCISFLKVDVEGFEYEVLKGNDWVRYRPEVLCLEANHLKRDWHKLLNKVRYKKVFFDGLNEYYVDEDTERASRFDYVNSVVIERGGGIRSEHFKLALRWQSLALDKINHTEELSRELKTFKKELKAKLEENKQLSNQLDKVKGSIKASIANAYLVTVKNLHKRLRRMLKNE